MNTISKRRKKMRERRCEEIVVCPKCRYHGAVEGGKEKKEKRRRRKRKKQD